MSQAQHRHTCESATTDAQRSTYWRERLADRPPALDLPVCQVAPPSLAEGRRQRTPFSLAGSRQRSFAAFLEREGCDTFEGLLAGWIATLFRTTRQDDLLVGVHENGCYGVVRIQLGDRPSFRELLRRTAVELSVAREHALPLGALLAATHCTRVDALFQTLFSLEGVDVRETAGLALMFSFAAPDRRDTPLYGELVHDAERFSPDVPMRMLGHLETLVSGGFEHPDDPIHGLPLLTSAEKKLILETWNDTSSEFPRDLCLHQLFHQRVRRCPDAPAVVFDGRHLTFAALDARANRLAHHLRSLGVGPNVVVGLCVERSFEMVVGLLAIAKSGGAYLPMDPAYPKERLGFMLEDSRVHVLLTQRHLVSRLPEPAHEVRLVQLDGADRFVSRPATTPESGVTAENLSYVIYTSGSTGKPKAVVLNHRGRVNNFLDFNRRFGVTTGDALIALASLSFDMCAYDVFGTLAAGATIVLCKPEELQDPAAWARLMNEHRVTIWHTVPAMLKMLVDYLERDPALAPKSLRLALLGGDWIPVSLPDRLRTLVETTRVISLGGATECSMDSTIYEVGKVDPEWRSIPYGAPMANQRAYVLDENLQLVPVHVAGELYLGGIGVGEGYHDRPELTAERFLSDPFSKEPGARMYRTGDLCRWMEDGNLELLGRIDNQVKLRGYRIELGEIEARLRSHPAVREAIVSAKTDASGEKQLAAYFVAHESVQPGPALRAELRSFLAAHLPQYMVPAFFTRLDALPLSPNGKVDRKHLPEPDTRSTSAASYMAPRDALEELLCEVWADVLGFDKVGVEDAFLDLGGHSILAVQIQSRLAEVFPFEVGLKELFEARTVARLADQVRKLGEEHGIDAEAVAGTLRKISHLSDEEVARRLRTGQ